MQARTKGFLTGCLFGALVRGVCGVSAKVKPVKQFLNTGGEKPPYTHVVTSPRLEDSAIIQQPGLVIALSVVVVFGLV